MIELAGEEKAALDRITERFMSSHEGPHRHARDTWARMDKLYRGYRDLKSSLRGTDGDPSRYPILNDARTEFGHELFIPYAFSIVETVLPRLLSNRPRMLVLPKSQASESNVENMRALIDDQQNEINYELKIQEAGKSGLMYGLGPMKTYWSKKTAETSKVAPASYVLRAMGHKYKTETESKTLCDGPRQDPLNVRDFFWDPYATSMDDMRWIIHRTWRDTDYVLGKIESGQWDQVDLTAEDLDQARSAQHYHQSRSDLAEAQHDSSTNFRDTDIHEVWEYHDRTNVVTVLDRKWIVASLTNEAWAGHLCFQAYRPTIVPNQFLGIGEIEPVEDLQYEMNMLRTHRRWNAEMVLHKAFFYADGMIDPRKFKIGPGLGIPVNGDPKDIIMPIEFGDIPFSSYREAQEIASDIERASGISDSTAGADAGAAQTATGIQLVQAAANARIQLKTQRAEIELIREGCRHWGAMNQRFILSSREIQIPAPPTPEEPDRMAVWLKLGPNELAGEFDFEPEGGSTTPENIPQKRQDFQYALQLLGVPGVDQRRILVWAMEQLGLKHPETYLAPDVHVPPGTLDLIVQLLGQVGMDPGQAQELVMGALNEALDAEQEEQNPAAAQVQDGQPPG